MNINRSSVQVQTWEPMTAICHASVFFLSKKKQKVSSLLIINLEVKKGRDNTQLKKKEIDNDRHLHIHPWTLPFSKRVISAGSIDRLHIYIYLRPLVVTGPNPGLPPLFIFHLKGSTCCSIVYLTSTKVARNSLLHLFFLSFLNEIR
jgi:hypothetical protein